MSTTTWLLEAPPAIRASFTLLARWLAKFRSDKEHLSRSGLINNYNGTQNKLDASTIKDMDTPFAGNRGTAIELTVERQTETQMPHMQPEKQQSWTDDAKKYKIGGISFAWIMGGTAALVGGVLTTPLTGRMGSFLARRRANKIMTRAERAMAKLAKSSSVE